jgi:hypothetical protein
LVWSARRDVATVQLLSGAKLPFSAQGAVGGRSEARQAWLGGLEVDLG